MTELFAEQYYLAAVCLILGGIGVLMLWCERKLQTKEIVTVAALSGIAVISRVVFFWFPQCKPMTAVVLASGSVFGPFSGMVIGILSAFLSNFIFGQGPWTPFQMLGLGLVGMIGGWLHTDRKWLVSIVAFLTVAGIYGPIVNFASYLMMHQKMSLQGFWIIELSGLPFDLVHAASTVVFLFFIWDPMRGKLMRLKTKYRILQRSQRSLSYQRSRRR